MAKLTLERKIELTEAKKRKTGKGLVQGDLFDYKPRKVYTLVERARRKSGSAKIIKAAKAAPEAPVEVPSTSAPSVVVEAAKAAQKLTKPARKATMANLYGRRVLRFSDEGEPIGEEVDPEYLKMRGKARALNARYKNARGLAISGPALSEAIAIQRSAEAKIS